MSHLSHLFIHIPKTGGMSVRRGLSERIVTGGPGRLVSAQYEMDVRATMSQLGQHHGLEHARWRDVRADLQELPAFAAVRNSWSRVASRYFFAVQILRQKKSKNWTVCEGITTFDSFLEQRHEYGSKPHFWHRAVHGWYPQIDYVTDRTGRIRCDIMRTECLADDLMAYAKMELPPRRRNVTEGAKPYQELYDDRTIQIVADWYDKDIEAFGFDFDTPATKNVHCV